MIGIYKITNNVNGKCYIGQSCDIDRRFKDHKRGNSSSRLLQEDRLKYGLSAFSFEVLEEVSPVDLDEKEIYWISYYHSNQADFGYNVLVGGNGPTVERRAKISRAQTDNSRKPNYHNPMEGTVIISKGEVTSRCPKDQLDEYISDGWKLGPSDIWREAHKTGGNTDYFKTHKFCGPANGFYGKKHTPETIQKIKDNMPDTSYNWRGKHHSEESKAKMRGPRPTMLGCNNPNYGKRGENSIMHGRRVITDGKVEKRVPQSELQQYLESGWKLGRMPKMADQLREMSSNIKGKIRQYDETGHFKYILKEES